MRLHARQAVAFGCIASATFLVLLGLPPILSLFISSSTHAIIVLYGIALGIDALFALFVVVLAVRYSMRAARGELFDVPLAAALGARLFPIRGDGG